MNFKNISKYLIITVALTSILSSFITAKAEDIIYNDESLAVSIANSPITLSVIKPKANGTDSTDLSFSLINSDKKQLLEDYYKLSIKSNNGTITPLTKDANGLYTAKFTTPLTPTESVIEVIVTYNYYACDEVESVLAEFDVDGQLFYDEGGYSIVNSRISQLTRGLTNEELDEIIYEEAQNVTGLEDWDTDDRQDFSDAYFDMVINLKCYKPGESTTLTSKIAYANAPIVDPIVTPPIPPIPVTPAPVTPAPLPAALPAALPVVQKPKPTVLYTPRTGSNNIASLVTLLNLGLLTAVLSNRKKIS